jgi:hypothetical protein
MIYAFFMLFWCRTARISDGGTAEKDKETAAYFHAPMTRRPLHFFG